MDMIWHDDVTGDLMTLGDQYIKPIVHQVIGIGYREKRNPLVAGESDEE